MIVLGCSTCFKQLFEEHRRIERVVITLDRDDQQNI
jgi:hypothetical protein